MMAFVAANLAPIMFASLIVFLLLGYSVAFSLAACGLFFFFVGIELDVPGMAALLQALPLRLVYGIMPNDTLLAIPFFTFMGLILERSGMAEDLLDTIGQLFGPIRGGLAFAVILVGAMLAATTGVVALRPSRGKRGDRGVRHARADHSALAGAHRPGRPARQERRRPVQGSVHPGVRADGAVCAVRRWRRSGSTHLGACAAQGSADHSRGRRLFGSALAARAIRRVRGRSDRLRQDKTRNDTDGRDHRHVDVPRRGHRLRARGHQQSHRLATAVAHGRARDLRADPAAGAHLPRARHHLPGHRNAHRRRRHGLDRCTGNGDRAPPARLATDSPGHGQHDEAVVLRALHLDRVDGVQPVLPGRGRTEMGRASADRPARRPARFPHRRQHPDLLPGVLPRLLRAVVHRDPADRPGGRQAGHRPGVR